MTAMTMTTKRSGSEVTTATRRRRRRRHSDGDEAQQWGMAAGYDDARSKGDGDEERCQVKAMTALSRYDKKNTIG